MECRIIVSTSFPGFSSARSLSFRRKRRREPCEREFDCLLNSQRSMQRTDVKRSPFCLEKSNFNGYQGRRPVFQSDPRHVSFWYWGGRGGWRQNKSRFLTKERVGVVRILRPTQLYPPEPRRGLQKIVERSGRVSTEEMQ